MSSKRVLVRAGAGVVHARAVAHQDAIPGCCAASLHVVVPAVFSTVPPLRRSCPCHCQAPGRRWHRSARRRSSCRWSSWPPRRWSSSRTAQRAPGHRQRAHRRRGRSCSSVPPLIVSAPVPVKSLTLTVPLLNPVSNAPSTRLSDSRERKRRPVRGQIPERGVRPDPGHGRGLGRDGCTRGQRRSCDQCATGLVEALVHIPLTVSSGNSATEDYFWLPRWRPWHPPFTGWGSHASLRGKSRRKCLTTTGCIRLLANSLNFQSPHM